MKKPIYFLFALFMLSMVSRNYAMNAKGNTMIGEDLMAKENKSLVQKKKYMSKDGYWTVTVNKSIHIIGKKKRVIFF